MVFLICRNCGQTEKFEDELSSNADISVINFVDGQGEFIKEKSMYIEDIHSEEHESYLCVDCNDETVEAFDTKDELDLFICQHTDSDGQWSEEELEEHEQNQELRKKLILNKI